MIIECDEREIEVIKYVIDGKSSIEIAEAIGYSVWAVKKILQSLYRRFGVNNRASLVREVIVTHKFLETVGRIC